MLYSMLKINRESDFFVKFWQANQGHAVDLYNGMDQQILLLASDPESAQKLAQGLMNAAEFIFAKLPAWVRKKYDEERKAGIR